MTGQRGDQVVALEVQGHQVNRRGHRTDRVPHGGPLALDVDGEVDLEDRDVGLTREAVRPGVHARTEVDDGADVSEILGQLVIDEALCGTR